MILMFNVVMIVCDEVVWMIEIEIKVIRVSKDQILRF